MLFLNFFRENKILFYALLLVIIILLACGTVALRGKSPTETYSKVGGLSDITLIRAYTVPLEWNGTLIECNVSEIRTDEKLFLQTEPPANLIQLYINQSVLDSNATVLALKISISGSQDFAYTLSVWKARNVTTYDNKLEDCYKLNLSDYDTLLKDCYNLTGRWTLYTGLINLANLQIYKGLAINRTPETIAPDLIELRVTNDRGKHIRENKIEGVEIADLAFIREKEGRVPPQPSFDHVFVPLSLYFLLILFFLPLLLLKKKGKYTLQVILILGFLLRIAIAPFTSHTYDILGCKRAVRTYYEQGELTLFTTWTSPPTWFFILITFHAPYVFLRLLGVPDFRIYYQPIMAMEVLFIKLPLILSDVMSAYLIYKICKKQNLDEGGSRLAAAVYMFNPFSIFISSIWGMFDSLAVSFMLLGLYFFVDNKFFACSLVWGLGVKWYTLGFIPLLSIVSFYKDKEKRTINRLLTSVLITVLGFGIFASLMIIPHILNGDLSYLKQVLDFRLKIGGGGEDRASLFTFFGPVLWKIFEKTVSIYPFPNFFLYTFGPPYAILLVWLFVYLRKSNFEKTDLFRVFNSTIIATLLLFYLTYPQLTLQCILWILPSLIFAYFVFHEVNAIPLIITSSLILPYVDTTYFIMGFSYPSNISLQAISAPLECVFGALLFSVAVNFLLKTYSPKFHVKISDLGERLLGNLSRVKLLLLYLGATVVLFLQVSAIFYIVDVLKFSSVFMVAPLAVTVTLQILILIAIDKA